jgi:hypothetical protein
MTTLISLACLSVLTLLAVSSRRPAPVKVRASGRRRS